MLNSYSILKSIGAGATSEVFKALNPRTDTIVALKLFHPVLMQDPELIERLRTEVEVLKTLRHPNVVGLQGEYYENGKYWLEIDFVDGGDLRKWLREYSQPLLEPKLFALVQIARGLGHAHEQAIIHRDLKPENILVSADGQVRITDFGLARSLERITVTRLGLLVGSLGYMAPEVINGGKATIQSDLFAFGVIAYEALTGKAPFQGESPQTLIRSICEGNYRPLREVAGRIPPQTADLIDRCLQVSPAARPNSIWEVEAEILNHLHSTGTLSICKALMDVKSTSLPEALRRKYQSISERAAGIISKDELTAESKREILFLASELKELFPGDPLLERIFQRLGNTPAQKPWKLWILAGLVVIFLAAAGFFYRSAGEPKHGYIHFQLDSSIAVKVDGHTLTSLDRQKYLSTPGTHKVEMSKSGFDPIVSEVEVTDGQTTLIKAEGQ
ncbi:MAG: serine/threonine protein kinase [Bdellovibrionales bacterium]